MKKRISAAALVLCLALVLSACGKAEKSVITGYSSGDVTLGQYTGIEYTPLSTEVTEDDIQAKLDSFVNNNKEKTEITDRTDVQSGDVATIDFTGYLDGEAFEGGTGTDYDLTIGAGQFIEGFEEGLIGVNVGETVDLPLTFPDPYKNNPDLAGKPVKFTVTVKSISTMVTPELTDALVADKTDYDTVEAYRAFLADQLKSSRESQAESQKREDVIDKVIENTTFKKDLTEDIKTAAENLLAQENSAAMSQYNVDAATLYSYFYGIDEATYRSFIEKEAERNVKFGLIASAIVEKENIECTEEEIAELAQSLLDSYGFGSVDQLYTQFKTAYNKDGKEVVAEHVKLSKAEQLMYDTAVAVAGVTE